jgi:uncharacterized DUF497 family protein
MSDDDFEWDEAKAASNYAKHRVRFIAARAAFKDVFAVGGVDDRDDYGEERFYIMGMVDGRLLHVTYTVRNGTIRIISARAAEPHEKRKYHEDNA